MIDKTLFTYSIGTVRPLAKVFHFADQLVAKTLRNHGEPEHVRTWLEKKKNRIQKILKHLDRTKNKCKYAYHSNI